MSLITWAKNASAIWASSPSLYQPKKSEIRAWGLTVERQLDYAIAFGVPMLNGTIVASVAANVLTIALKTLAGADPSAGDPVYVIFPNGSGGYDVVKVTAATALTISAGSELGVQAGYAFCLWVTIWNNSGSVELGVRRCNWGGSIYPLGDSEASSTTAEGGAGGADSPGVHYTTSALSAKPYRILARLDWDAALATPGLWDTAPSRVQLYSPGMKRPGDVIYRSLAISTAVGTGTTTTPLDDSKPQVSGEGNEVCLTGTFGRIRPANPIRLVANFYFAVSTPATVVWAMHRVGVADAVRAEPIYCGTANKAYAGAFSWLAGYSPATADQWSLRAGMDTAGTLTWNGASGSRLMGGAGFCTLEYEEIQA